MESIIYFISTAMNHVLLLNLTLFFTFSCSYGQRRGEKKFSSADISAVYIQTDFVSTIEILNTSRKEIKIKYSSEGEYENMFVIQSKRTKSTLHISDDIQPFLEKLNDKLAAHKISAAKMTIFVPENISIYLISKQANCIIDAKLHYLFAELNSGIVRANYFEGNADVHTISGAITLYTKNATLTTRTNTGNILTENMLGNHSINLISLNGDINVYKIK
ncbi:DUF4097 family beta strand repeat-containing protein [Aquimarina intermedia]|uniref:Adhesin domain-containing protein n=1 Tax=Aquimarina intermedia TaxID=350814 RepID=A0A5S5CEI5_9FLAO|nr:hypothetical protein [Aquimarina intermedia]TYP77068.1 hypothetical protein BD809_101216 [Aquimarina intermedia]